VILILVIYKLSTTMIHFYILIIHATDNSHITSTTSRSGKVETHNYKRSRYDPTEPRSLVATYEDYNRSRRRSPYLGSGKSRSQIVKTASDTPIGSETKLFGSRESAIPVPSFDCLPSTVGEGTIDGSIQIQKTEADIQDLFLAEAFLISSGRAATLANFSENANLAYTCKATGCYRVFMDQQERDAHESRPHVVMHSRVKMSKPFDCSDCKKSFQSKGNLLRHGKEFQHQPYACECGAAFSRVDVLNRHLEASNTDKPKGNSKNNRAQGLRESTINITKAEVSSGTSSIFLGGNEESAWPQTICDSPALIGDSVPDDKIALGTQETESMDRGLSFSSSSDYHGSEPEHNGSDNASDELCDRLDDVHVDRERIMTPILDPARQAMVDRVMEEFWVIFNTRWSSNVRQRAGDSHQESGPSGTTITYQNTGQSRSTQRKRKWIGDENDPDRGSDRSDQPPSQSIASGDVPADRSRFACPFRKHDPCRYNIYSHRLCALSHWPSIARVKY
jgi:hypothetical protein